MIEIYRLTQSADCEGRTTRTVGYFSSESTADQLSRSGFGSMSMGSTDGVVREVKVYESISEFALYHAMSLAELKKCGMSERELKEALRNRAVAKLTPEERAALDLK